MIARKRPTSYTCVDCKRERPWNGSTTITPKRCLICTSKREHERAVARGKSPVPPKSRKKQLPHRNEKRRPAALATAQREAVIERSGGRCEFETYKLRVVDQPWCGDLVRERIWDTCGANAADTAHIIRRRLCGDAIYHPDVALFACRWCHIAFDARGSAAENVRVPDHFLAAAIAAVKAAEAERIERNRATVPLPPGAQHQNGEKR